MGTRDTGAEDPSGGPPLLPSVSAEYEAFFRRHALRLSSLFHGLHFNRVVWLRDGLQEPVKPLKVYAVHDMDANVKHGALLVPALGLQREVAAIAACAREQVDDLGKGVVVVGGNVNSKLGQTSTNTDLVFPNRVTILTDVLHQPIGEVRAAFQAHGLSVHVYDEQHWEDLVKAREPDLFICHDSRDKDDFVRPLVHALAPHMLKVWYDEHSLRIGDSLIDKIEEGLQTCRFGVMVVSPNLIANHRWPKREFRSLMTRDIEDGHGIILPVWFNVDRKAVRAYSLDLADRVAEKATGPADAERVARAIAEKVREKPKGAAT